MRLARLLAALPVCLLLLVPAAHADPGTATLTASPNPVTAYYAGAVEFAGCGYPVGGWVDVYVAVPGAAFGSVVGSGPADAAGCIGIVTAGWVGAAGDYPASAVQQVQTGQTVKLRDLAGTTVSVVG